MWIAIVVALAVIIVVVMLYAKSQQTEDMALDTHEGDDDSKRIEAPRVSKPESKAMDAGGDRAETPPPKKTEAKAKVVDADVPVTAPDNEDPPSESRDEDSEAEVPVDLGADDEQVAPTSRTGEDAATEEQAPAQKAKDVAPSAQHRSRDVRGLRKGLGKARGSEGFFGRLAKLITGRKEIDADIVDDLEEVLITSDVGVQTTEVMLERIKDGLKRKELDDPSKVWSALREQAVEILSKGDGGLSLTKKPTVVLMVGVNGSGKTTTIGKLATQLVDEGKTVVLAAGDTFRAAAVQQLAVWGRRVGCEVVRGKDGADPSAVIFDAVKKGIEVDADVVLADTAGRLHTKAPLMDELKKIARTMGKALDGAPHETFLVIDATTGQNAVAQSREFSEALPLSGIVLTKLDGTARGGVVLGICDELKVPVRYIGVGERADDLRTFDAEEFVEALLGTVDEDESKVA